MVEKRTITLVMLLSILLAALASTFAGYYFLQNQTVANQLNSAQNSLGNVTLSYSDAIKKYDFLLAEYASLHDNYSAISNSDYTSLMSPLGRAIADTHGNYSDVFEEEDMNQTYTQLLSDYETLSQKGNITKTDVANVLDEYHKLFETAALRELALSISKTTTLSVSMEIDYGNETVEWHNVTNVPAGCTLFNLTQDIATVKYSYYAFAEPGHVLIDSINNKTSYTDPSYTWGYTWIWQYWNNHQKAWTSGSVGCDAWLLESGGVYKWSYERWSYP